VEWDPAEAHPFNVSDYPDIYSMIDQEYLHHNSTVIRGPPQYDAQNWTLVPCCNGPINDTDIEKFIREHEWSLALWDELGCVCLEEKLTN